MASTWIGVPPQAGAAGWQDCPSPRQRADSRLGGLDGRRPRHSRRFRDAERPYTTPHDTSHVTGLLLDSRDGSRAALDRLFPLLYDELRRIARIHLRREADGHTLATTALVHEAWLRLVDVTRVEWRDRVHFLSMAARAMRRILVDHARRRSALRRGGGPQPITLDDALLGVNIQTDTLLALDDALDRLRTLSPRLVQVVECRFFAGMTEEETAAALGVTSRTVRNDWVKARGWLRQALQSGD